MYILKNKTFWRVYHSSYTDLSGVTHTLNSLAVFGLIIWKWNTITPKAPTPWLNK